MARQQDDGIFAFILGLFTGVLAGGVLGLLFAPKSGEETREDLEDLAKRLPDEIKDPNSKSRHFIEKTKANIEHQVSEAKHRRDADRMAKAKRAEELASGNYELN
ncbi:MAG: YtxH domain-containing protein [Vampirovibrionales bacterium]|nr:YtxH domain-containing protein [Vampirovibrionales bacterium]